MSPLPLQLVHVDPSIAPSTGDVPVYDAGSGVYVPTAGVVGAGNVSTSSTLTAGKLVIGAGTTDVDISAATATVMKLTAGTPSSATDGTDYVSPTTQRIVQVVNTQTGAASTGTTTIPADDTIPQITEGTEFMTLAITPTSATNKLKIDVVFLGASGTANRNICVALFQDSTADALAVSDNATPSGGFIYNIKLSHYMTAGTTSATTFRVRAGVETSGTVTFNGSGGSRLYGGVMASSITITEIKV